MCKVKAETLRISAPNLNTWDCEDKKHYINSSYSFPVLCQCHQYSLSLPFPSTKKKKKNHSKALSVVCTRLWQRHKRTSPCRAGASAASWTTWGTGCTGGNTHVPRRDDSGSCTWWTRLPHLMAPTCATSLQTGKRGGTKGHGGHQNDYFTVFFRTSQGGN